MSQPPAERRVFLCWKLNAGTSKNFSFRHCERREATQKSWNFNIFLDCFASLAMTEGGFFDIPI
jgi:hypothetical protein